LTHTRHFDPNRNSIPTIDFFKTGYLIPVSHKKTIIDRKKMIHFKRSQILILSILSLFGYQVRGHGYLKTPRSRNYVADASQEGTWTSAPGVPKAESCPHCLNRKEAHKVCGKTQTMDYDDWNDSQGNPMSWASQGVYEAGDLFTVESYLSANHAG
jgi:hypothetical protein